MYASPSLYPRRRPPPRSPLFPYTTLFRSSRPSRRAARDVNATTAANATAKTTAHVAASATRSGVPVASSRSVTRPPAIAPAPARSEEHTSELQSRGHLVCRLLLEKKKIHN